MTIKVGINGFGRIGRLVMRAAWAWEDIEFIHINEPAGTAETLAHLVMFDSVHGRWTYDATASNGNIVIDDQHITCSHNSTIAETDWSECDVVIEASGVMKSSTLLQAYIEQGVKRVVVTAPVKEDGVLNIVMGVNHSLYDTTIHDITNTQTILDAPHKDLRRARACGMSLIPTTTGSATAITQIFPELDGKLNGHAVRVPLANASITDCVFELKQKTTAEEVNALFKTAADSYLKGVLGYEERPLVSIDYKTDPRSCIIDALSTMVVNGSQLKVYAWYDNEWGYANRTAELMHLVGKMDYAQ